MIQNFINSRSLPMPEQKGECRVPVPGCVIMAGQLVECGSIYEIKATLRPDIRKLIRTHCLIPLDRPVKSTTFLP